MTTSVVQSRVNKELKRCAEEVFESLGMDTATAIRMFLTQVVQRQGLPFEVKIADPFFSPANMARLLKAIEDVESGRTFERELVETE